MVFLKEVMGTGIGLWPLKSLAYHLVTNIGSLKLQLMKLHTHLILVTGVLRLQTERPLSAKQNKGWKTLIKVL